MEKSTITCVTWNILAQRFATQVSSWEERRQCIETLLLTCRADLILLQELELDTFAHDFPQLLADYDYVIHQRTKKRTNVIGNVVLWLRTDYSIETTYYGYAHLSCRLKHKSGRLLHVCNVHLKGGLYTFAHERASQLKSALKFCDETPCILGGDFNDDLKTDGPVYVLLESFKGRDTKIDTCFVTDKYWPFDYLLSRRLERLSTLVDASEGVIPNGSVPSDHLLVRSVFSWID